MIQKKVIDAIHDLSFDWHEFSLKGFIDFLAQYRMRPIYTLPLPDLEKPFVFSLGTTDYIVFNNQNNRMMQQHDILHELAHLLLDHVQSIQVVSDFEQLEISLHIGFRDPTRASGQSVEENEAEYFVYLIQQKLQDVHLLQALTDDDRTGDPQMPPFTRGLLK